MEVASVLFIHPYFFRNCPHRPSAFMIRKPLPMFMLNTERVGGASTRRTPPLCARTTARPLPRQEAEAAPPPTPARRPPACCAQETGPLGPHRTDNCTAPQLRQRKTARAPSVGLLPTCHALWGRWESGPTSLKGRGEGPTVSGRGGMSG